MRNHQVNILYLLDRNAVSIIRKSIDGSNLREDEIEKIEELKKLNTPINKISPLLSILEGEKRRNESIREMHDTIKKESKAVSLFYDKAITDSKYLNDNIVFALLTFSGKTVEVDWPKYISFCIEAQKYLIDIKKEQRETIKEKIINIARGHSVLPNKPIVVCFLSALYGSQDAMGVIKPKKQYTEHDAYNTVSDLSCISRLAFIDALFPDITPRLITYDKKLLSYLDKVTYKGSIIKEKIYDADISITVSYSRLLFPTLDDLGYDSLMSELI